MKKSFKRIVILFLVAAMMFTMVACGNDDSKPAEDANTENSEETTNEENSDKKIAFVSPANQFDFFVYIGAKVKQIGEEKGIQVDCFDANLDVAKQSDQMTQIILQKYDAIIVGPVDTSAIEPSIAEANEAGIPVINYDAFIENGDFYARVGSDNKEMGASAAKYAVELLKEKYGEEKGEVFVLDYPQLSTMHKRTSGFVEELAQYPNINIIQENVEQCTAEAGQKLTDDLLIANQKGSIDIMFGSNAGVVLGALSAITSANRNEIALLGIDNEEGQLTALQDGKIYKATIAQDPVAIGQAAMNAAIEAINGEKVGDIAVPEILVTTENVDEYLDNQVKIQKELEPYK